MMYFTGKVYIIDMKIMSMLILDDDVDMLMCQKDNFIHVDSYEALTEEDINKAIDIFERKNKKIIIIIWILKIKCLYLYCKKNTN